MSDPLKSPHIAFTVNYKNRTNALKTSCMVANPFIPMALPVKGSAIWDTGATNTVISKKLAQKLKLIPIGKGEVRGVNSRQVVNRYIINIPLPNNLNTVLNVMESDIGNEINVLIGMDIIGDGDFAICNGKVFSFCIPPFEESPIDFLQKAAKINPRIMKKIKKNKRKS